MTVIDSDALTAFHAACARGYTEVVKLLIDVGMNENDTTNAVVTPLLLGGHHGHTDTLKILLNLMN